MGRSWVNYKSKGGTNEHPRPLEAISKPRLTPDGPAAGGIAGRLPAFGGTHILPCMLRFFADLRLALKRDLRF
jgi:hypothetical protein